MFDKTQNNLSMCGLSNVGLWGAWVVSVHKILACVASKLNDVGRSFGVDEKTTRAKN